MAKTKRNQVRRKPKKTSRFAKPGGGDDVVHNDRPNRHRIRQEDLATAIFQPKQQDRVTSNVPTEEDVLVFTIAGKEDDRVLLTGEPNVNGFPVIWNEKFDDDTYLPAEERDIAYAKIEMVDGRAFYYIKQGPNARYFNPIGIYDEGRHMKRHAGEHLWKFRRVNRAAFDLYIKFLQTKNQTYLIAAEREMV